MKKKIVICVAVILIIFILSPLFPYGVSMGVMSAYSGHHERESIMAEKGIQLEIPGGNSTKEKDWYPFVMTFNAEDRFGRWAGDSRLRLTILYNFPAFDLRKGCSRLYDSSSPYYNGFYGAYLVTGGDTPFGFNDDGSLDISKTALVPQYDFQELVLRAFGIAGKDRIFDWEITHVQEGVGYAGSEDWTQVDAVLLVNGVLHEKEGFAASYLQYGTPKYDLGGNEEFKPIQMVGRIYGKYFEKWDCSIFFYILSADEEVLAKCDEEILSLSKLE